MQKQTKPEPLGLSMAKLVLAVAVVVSLGAVLGVAGWMVKNKPVKIQQPQVSVNPKEVIITTDKSEYNQEETVEITIQNNLNQSIWYWDYTGRYIPLVAIQKFQDGEWIDLENKDACACETNCITYAAGWIELKPKAAITDSWETKEDCLGKTIKDGKYRVGFSYDLDSTGQNKQENFSKVYSKEFNIKSETADWKTYRNEEYGYEVTLLDSWEGYSTLTEYWRGTTLDGSSTQYQGPEIIIRNPKWSATQPWQDIPIMVFIKEEWKLIEAENLNVSASPVGPIKLGENQKYVFALPPRWVGFTDALGQDEAQEIAETFKPVLFSLNETADWKTYRNEEYGFEFDIPNDWEVKEVPSEAFYVFIKSPDYTTNTVEPFNVEVAQGAEILVSIRQFSSDLEFKNIKDLQEFNKLGIRGSAFINEQIIKMEGEDALLYDYEDKSGHILDFLHNNIQITISIRYAKESDGQGIFNQILSTFKFIE